MSDNDPIAAALSALPSLPLDPDVASRVRGLARAELAPASSGDTVPARLRLAVSGAIVPALLLSAAVTRTTETVQVAAKIYGHHDGRG